MKLKILMEEESAEAVLNLITHALIEIRARQDGYIYYDNLKEAAAEITVVLNARDKDIEPDVTVMLERSLWITSYEIIRDYTESLKDLIIKYSLSIPRLDDMFSKVQKIKRSIERQLRDQGYKKI